MSSCHRAADAPGSGTSPALEVSTWPARADPAQADARVMSFGRSQRRKTEIMGGLSSWLTRLILVMASSMGLLSFLFPFLTPAISQQQGAGAVAHAAEAPLLLIIMVVLCLGAVLASLQGREMNSKTIAVLGILVAINAALRVVPGPAGFAAVFMLPILAGYAYGPTFGFLLGALSLLVSALLGAGVGPWLPFQMFAAGWVGMSSAWLPKVTRWPRVEAVMVAAWGTIWGFLFGAIMNIWFWPYVYQPQSGDMYWQSGLGILESLKRYAAFYAATSLWWDLGRAGGNLALLLLFGAPVLRLLRRFGRRFQFERL